MPMSSLVKRIRMRIAVVGLALLMSALQLDASDRRSVSRPGEATERLLRQYEIETDTDSLLVLVREKPKSPWVASAISLLAWRRAEEALPLLREILVDSRYTEHRATIAWGLAKLGDSRGIEALERLLESARDEEVRLRLARSLADVARSRAGLAVAIELSRSTDAETRAASLRILVDYLVWPRTEESDISLDEIVEALFQLSRDPELSVRKQFVEYSSIAIRNGAPKKAILDRLRELCREDPSEALRADLERRLEHWAFSEGRIVEEGETCP